MLIKTVQGLELGGGVSGPTCHRGVSEIQASQTVSVEFKFTCTLNAGAYFLNAGVSGTVKGAETYLHRVLDICMFKVLPDPDNTSTGIMDFRTDPNIVVNKNDPSD